MTRERKGSTSTFESGPGARTHDVETLRDRPYDAKRTNYTLRRQSPTVGIFESRVRSADPRRPLVKQAGSPPWPSALWWWSVRRSSWGVEARFTDSDGGVLDAATTVVSLAPQWMLTRKLYETWWLWFTVDAV